MSQNDGSCLYPEDVQAMSTEELENLAEKLREQIIETVAQNGGHLASNLGVIELTLALHCQFSSPKDKIVWDVGHQCYAHKILTGRGKEFCTLRTYQGLSGFPKSKESAHDIVEVGHSSTSLSQALGLALARDKKGLDYHVLAVIGDGALTGGMALEALNHIGHLQRNLIVILNDNEMSISPNVGAISDYLGRLRSDPTYHRIKDDIEMLVKKIPAIGGHAVKAMDRVRKSLKYLVVPGIFFEELGFTYLGPVEGHQLDSLQNYLQRAKKMEGPVLVHVITQKGYGYAPAEQNPGAFHGTGPFDIETGKSLKQKKIPAYTDVFSESLCVEARKNPDIVAITAAMPDGTGLERFSRLYPDRFFDVGIAEQHGVTMAAGMAREGLRPVVAIYSTFLQRAYDQIIHDVCLPNLPVTFAVDRGGLVGDDGETHHGVFDLSYLRHIPNMTLAAPRDENELKHMLRLALSHDGPFAFRFPRGSGPNVPLREGPPMILGTGEVVREGEGLVICTLGHMVWRAIEAAEILQKQGIDAKVIDIRFLKPLDDELLWDVLERSQALVTIEDNVVQGGLGGAITEWLARQQILLPTLNLGLPDTFIPHGTVDVLLEKYGLSPEAMAATILDFAYRTSGEKGVWPSFEKKIRRIVGRRRAFFIKD